MTITLTRTAYRIDARENDGSLRGTAVADMFGWSIMVGQRPLEGMVGGRGWYRARATNVDSAAIALRILCQRGNGS
jgi:hypothetical protein